MNVTGTIKIIIVLLKMYNISNVKFVSSKYEQKWFEP